MADSWAWWRNTFNPSTQGAKAGESLWTQDKPGLLSETLLPKPKNSTWWYTPVISALGRQSQKDRVQNYLQLPGKFKTSVGYYMRPHLKLMKKHNYSRSWSRVCIKHVYSNSPNLISRETLSQEKKKTSPIPQHQGRQMGEPLGLACFKFDEEPCLRGIGRG